MSNLRPELLLFLNSLKNFKKSDSYKLFLFLRENRTIVSILLDNYHELKNVLKLHGSDDVKEKFLDIDSNFRFKFQRKIRRLFSNYLCSMFALVDYSRKTSIKYLKENEAIFEKFNEKKKKNFSEDKTHKFIQDLRDYNIHHTSMKIGSRFSRIHNLKETEYRTNIYLEKAELLLSSYSWNSLSKSFIELQEDKINLDSILKEHFLKFIEFQNWTFMQIFLVDEIKTKQLLIDIKYMLDEATSINQPHFLGYKQSYVRYIEYVYKKALDTKLTP